MFYNLFFIKTFEGYLYYSHTYNTPTLTCRILKAYFLFPIKLYHNQIKKKFLKHTIKNLPMVFVIYYFV